MFWDVYLNGRKIDSVWYDKNCNKWYVKHTLINHDGYPSNIKVYRAK